MTAEGGSMATKSSGEWVDRKRVFSILRTRLDDAPPDVKETFPTVVRQNPPKILVSAQPNYLMVVYLSPEEDVRIKRCIDRRMNLFPGLIATGGEPAAFRLDGSKYVTIDNNEISNLFALSLGPDSTVWLQNHHQSINTSDAGRVSYTVALAYIVTYGKEIDRSTVYDYLDGLVVHSVKEWRTRHATGQPEV
jgi:hypothetical protein